MLRLLWSLPFTLAGRALAFLGGCHQVGTFRDARLYAPSGKEPLLGRFFRRYPVGAFTWGHTIILKRALLRYDEHLLAHEYQHTRQAAAWGPFFPLVYLAAMAWARARGGHPYRDCYLEAEARHVADREVPRRAA